MPTGTSPPTACAGRADVARGAIGNGPGTKTDTSRALVTRALVCSLIVAVLVVPAAGSAAAAEEPVRLVFGSFRSVQNATDWAARLTLRLDAELGVEAVSEGDGVWYRVVTRQLDKAELARVSLAAQQYELRYWRLRGSGPEVPGSVSPLEPNVEKPAILPAEELREPAAVEVAMSRREAGEQMLDVDLGLQSRTFFQSGLEGQSKYHPSVSLKADYYRSWDGERQSFTAAPFFRYDDRDSHRTHFDLREFFWTRVGDGWDVNVGVQQVFWGVTEFAHLVDIINQTDLVDDIDTETKLGQPMVQLSLIRDWGILDFFVLTGFRERTFPGKHGRLRYVIPVNDREASFDSGAGSKHIDGAIRWSHHVGPLDFGIYHFSGTSRDPLFEVLQKSNGEYFLRPRYPVIDQSGLDAQMIFGDWAWKLEAITRSGFGHDRYAAATGGFERTVVGVLGTRTDLGLIAEYLWDERGDEAFDNFFEHDVALGTRWQLNDVAGTQALLGVVLDTESDEWVVKLEASRRLGDTWTLLVEGRAFGGTDALNPDDPLPVLLDTKHKFGAIVHDDYLQLELTRYF